MAEIRPFEVTTGGFRFSGRACGPDGGRLVILLHGFPETSRSWQRVLGALGEAGFTAVAPDQRGYSAGARPEGVEHYAIDRLAADVLAIADDVGGHAFDLVGHDWGGGIAWYVAAMYPERLRTLTVVSTPHPAALSSAIRGDIAGDQAERSSYMDFFRQPEVPEQAMLANDAMVLRAAYGGVVDDDTVEEYVRVLSEPGAMTAALNYYRATSLADPPATEAIAVPTLYVWSTGDQFLGREAAEATGAHVAADYRFEVLDGVSHWIPEEAPDRLAALLLEHLETHA